MRLTVKPIRQNENAPEPILTYINTLQWYQTHEIRKNAILAAEIIFSNEHPDQQWAARTKEWIKQKLCRYDEKALISFNEQSGGIVARIVPIDETGKLSYRTYFGRPVDLSILNKSYISYCNTGILSGDATQNSKQEDVIRLKEQIKGLTRENRHLRNLCQSYIEFISEYGNMKRARSMIKSAKHLQYAIRGFQEDGNKDTVNLLISLLERGKVYMKEHNIT